MANKEKPVLAVVKSAKKPKPSKKTGSGGNNGGGGSKSAIKRAGDYKIVNGAYYLVKTARSNGDGSGEIEIPLCDFTCTIIEEKTLDNGLEDQAVLSIEGTRQDGLPLPAGDVLASKFFGGQGNWPNELWGSRVFIQVL